MTKATVPIADAKTITNTKTINTTKVVLPVSSLIKVSKLTFKFDAKNKTEIIGSITNNNKLDTDVKFMVMFSNMNGISMSYNVTIKNNCVKTGETVKFNVPIYGTNVRHKIYTIKIVSQDSQI